MRAFLFTTTIVVLLAACSPPAPQQDRPESAPGPQVVACNDVVPDASRQIGVAEAVAAAAAAADLRGGEITPGTYDLVRAVRIGAATGWEDTQAVALEVSEEPSGAVTFNWAAAPPDAPIDRWTASFTETPQPRVTYTCGRMGEVPAQFATAQTSLQLRLPDGAGGQLSMDFERRQ